MFFVAALFKGKQEQPYNEFLSKKYLTLIPVNARYVGKDFANEIYESHYHFLTSRVGGGGGGAGVGGGGLRRGRGMGDKSLNLSISQSIKSLFTYASGINRAGFHTINTVVSSYNLFAETKPKQ